MFKILIFLFSNILLIRNVCSFEHSLSASILTQDSITTVGSKARFVCFSNRKVQFSWFLNQSQLFPVDNNFKIHHSDEESVLTILNIERKYSGSNLTCQIKNDKGDLNSKTIFLTVKGLLFLNLILAFPF